MTNIIRAMVVVLAVSVLAGFLMTGCKKTQPVPSASSPRSGGINAPAPGTSQPTVPLEARLQVQKGIELVKSHDYDASLKEFSEVIGKYPDYIVAYYGRAGAYMQQKKFDKAKDDLDKALQINPHSPVTYYNFAALYSLQGKSDLALDSLDRALTVGFKDYDYLRSDPDMNNIRKLPGYRKILEAHKVFVPN